MLASRAEAMKKPSVASASRGQAAKAGGMSKTRIGGEEGRHAILVLLGEERAR